MEREKFGSRLGFILISAGCAIGLGNVWRFPYIVGKYGGAAFVLIYLAFLLILGLPVMVAEFAVGRASQKSAACSFDVLEPKGTKWHLYKYGAIAGNYLLMMFYTTIAGWMILYFVKMATGQFDGLNSDQVGEAFSHMLGQPVLMTVFMAIAVLLCFGICAKGLQKGVERITKVMMVCLLSLMVVLAVRSVLLPGGQEGLKFYLYPDFGKVKEAGIGEVVYAAMGQAFFTLSIGIGALAIFGSYIGKERALTGEAVSICVLDTFVALMSGLIIFPSCFAYNVQPDSGPSLIFISLPKVFASMGAIGRIIAIAFFLMMGFAALTSCVSVMETLVANCMEIFHKSRQKMCAVIGIYSLVTAVLICLGYNVLYFEVKLPNGTVAQLLDIMDYISNSFLMPFISLLTSILIGWVVGPKLIIDEVERNGEHFRRAKLYCFMIRYAVPVVMLILFLVSTGIV